MSTVEYSSFTFSSNNHKYEYAQNLLEQYKHDTNELLEEKFQNEEHRAIARISLEICSEMMWRYMKHRIDHGGTY